MILPNPPNDYSAERCGHNFHPMECPYEFCGYRDTLKALEGLLKALSEQAAKASAEAKA